MNVVNQGGKGIEGVGWEATLNKGDSPSFPDTCHVCGCVTRFEEAKMT